MFGPLQCIENEPDLLNLIITCDETWIFTYDPETSDIQYCGSHKKKSDMSCLKLKAMLDIQGIVMAEWVPSSQMANQQYYTEVLTKLCERVRRK